MRKTFEDLIFDKEGESDGWQTTYTFSTILELMTEVREATIKECAKEFGKNHIQRNKDFILFNLNSTLDKNSIEIL